MVTLSMRMYDTGGASAESEVFVAWHMGHSCSIVTTSSGAATVRAYEYSASADDGFTSSADGFGSLLLLLLVDDSAVDEVGSDSDVVVDIR